MFSDGVVVQVRELAVFLGNEHPAYGSWAALEVEGLH
jgi:hypothetical protein